MARKKSRPASSTAVMMEPSRAVTANAPVRPEAGRPETGTFAQTPLGSFLKRLFRIASSLQLAITLLSLFTCCLILATYLESWYNASIARELIYGTWWFTLLLFLLATNILCAALKKYPWKKHQTGFLITHTGLLTLCFGGLLDSTRSVEGQIQGIDSRNPEILQETGLPNQSGTINLYNTHQIEILSLSKGDVKNDRVMRAAEILANIGRGRDDLDQDLVNHLGDRYTSFHINPGSFAWHEDQDFKADLPLGVRVLNKLASPLPSFEQDLHGKAVFTVKNYYPNTQLWPVSKPNSDDASRSIFPALRVRLKTPMNGNHPVEEWALGMPSLERGRLPLGLDLFATSEPAFVNLFNNPPQGGAELGKDGQLVVALGAGARQQLFRIPVDRSRVGSHFPLGDTGLLLTVKGWGHLTDFDLRKEHKQEAHDPEEFPTVQVQVSGDRETATYLACARLPKTAGLIEGRLSEHLALWYHPGDFRWGRKSQMGALQFLQGPEGKVYYRLYGKDGLRQPGQEIDPNDPEATYQLKTRMEMSFQVTAYLPEAVKKVGIVPVNFPLGTEAPPTLQPALKYTLTIDGQTQEFWVRMGTRSPLMDVNGQKLLIRYRQATRDAGFQVRFNRAREIKDEGSDRPAWFESEITLLQQMNGKLEASEHRLYMNHTLDVGNFRLFQANYKAMTYDNGAAMTDEDYDLGALMAAGPSARLLVKPRPVSMSGLAVKYDPGLIISARWWMYDGSMIVVLGIATMFWMRAYFFKPRGTRPQLPGILPTASVS